MSTLHTEPPVTTNPAYADLLRRTKEAKLLDHTASLLSWDQETFMPPGGLAYRSQQLAQLARMSHEQATDPRIGELLGECEADKSLTADPLSIPAVNLRELRHDYDRATKLPATLVEEFARATSMARAEWVEARKANDFKRFEPHLRKLVDLLREKAKCFGWPDDGEPWDALAEDYEPGCTAKEVAAVFAPLRQRLVTLVGELTAAPNQPNEEFNQLKLGVEQQQKFVRFVARQIGFDFNRGRLDISAHPFCSGTNRDDIRMTTRFHDDLVVDALGSTMHESGHGIYNQNVPGGEHVDTPFGDSVSLGIHESQSRMWENQVGRSPAFWRWLFPKLGEFFGNATDGLTFDDVYGAANIVRPSLIRVEADEATYNLHIMVRFEIERAVIAGSLDPADIPAVWNERYKDYLGIDVPNDREGCLQDIHWSLGAMGYFPTYTLGNLYAAQFFEKAQADIGDLDGQFERGEFDALRDWLVDNIHSHGMRYRAADLCEHVTGQPLSAEPLMRHLEGKLKPLYGV